MSELNAGQIIDEATRLAGKNEPDAMDLVPMHRWWWRYSQNLDSMLRHALLDHDQMPAALRRLSAQAEPAKDALKWATDFVMQYVHGSEIAGDDIDDLITSLAVRLSASGQGEPREDDELVELWAVVMESIVEIDHGRPMRARDILVSAYDDGLPCQRCPQSTAPAPEKGNAQMADECAKACDRIDAMDSGQVGACLGVTAPEKGEARS